MSKKIQITNEAEKPAMSNFWQRAITGTVFVSVLIGCIIASKYAFGILFLLFTLFGVWEFYRLTKIDRILPLRVYGTVVAGILFVITYAYAFGYATFKILLVIILNG